jgi:hypothetical protein
MCPALISIPIGGDKRRRMKKQTVVILAIIAVITTLLTAGAFINEVEYNLSPCSAIDISLGNATVTNFLTATNMTTVEVYNFKGYKGENTWMVQWSSSDRLLNVHVNVATGNIVGIEEKPVPEPTPTPETETWHSVTTFRGNSDAETDPFTIQGTQWRVKWKADGGFQSSAIRVQVYKYDKMGFMKDVVDEWRSIPSSGTKYNYAGPGKYLFYVTATDLDYWELKVEDYY